MYKIKFYLMACALIGSSLAFANPKDLSNVEKIEVTGSRIKRINIEGPSPIIILDKNDLEQSGYSTVADVLRETSIDPSGIARERSGSSISGNVFASIHGASVLVLINGKRVVDDPNALAVDLNLIPIAAIERVEILKDGSSALYGSDALGGVINFIMKKGFDGLEIRGQITPTIYPHKGGSRVEGSIVWGKTLSQGSMTGVLQARFNHGILAKDRAWSNGQTSGFSPYPTFTVKVPEGGKAEPVIVSEFCPPDSNKKDFCEFDYTPYFHSYPNLFQLSGYFQADYKWKGLEYYMQILPSYSSVKYIYPPIPGRLKLKSNHKLSVAKGKAGTLNYRYFEAGNREFLTHNFGVDTLFGVKGYLNSTWDWDFSTKFSGILKNRIGQGRPISKKLNYLIDNGLLSPFKNAHLGLEERRGLFTSEALIAQGAPSDPDPSPLHTTNSYDHSLLSLADLVFTGSYGGLNLALGSQAFFNFYEQVPDSLLNEGALLSGVASEGIGTRVVFSSYAESSYLFSDTLEIQLAGRMDYYTDINLNPQTKEEELADAINRFSVNPKLAFRYQPSKNFLVRGSVGSSFIAPTMEQLYGSKSKGYLDLYDYVGCFNEITKKGLIADINDEQLVKEFLADQKEVILRADLSQDNKSKLGVLVNRLQNKDASGNALPEKDASGNEIPENAELSYCREAQIFTETAGNTKLDATNGWSAFIGTVVQLNQDSNFIVDLWYLRTDQSPSYGINNDMLKSELLKGGKYVLEQGVAIYRNKSKEYSPIGVIDEKEDEKGIVSKYLNIGKSDIMGIDLSYSQYFSQHTFKGGNFYLKKDLGFILSSREEIFPGRGFKDHVGKYGQPRWIYIGVFGWTNKTHDISLKILSNASTSKTFDELQSLPVYHRLDLAYTWNKDTKTVLRAGFKNILSSTWGSEPTLRNLFFSNPPEDDTINGTNKINTSLHDPRGPNIYVSIKRLL